MKFTVQKLAIVAALTFAASLLIACQTKQQTGILVGSTGGALIGHQLSGGGVLGTVGGAVAGGVAGGMVGHHMDEHDKASS